MKKERQPGFYWVSINDKLIVGEWTEDLSNMCWQLPGYGQIFLDGDLDEIIETPIQPPSK